MIGTVLVLIVLVNLESNLPDGNYNIDYFWSYETGWIELNINFTVQDGKLVEKLDITLPAPY